MASRGYAGEEELLDGEHYPYSEKEDDEEGQETEEEERDYDEYPSEQGHPAAAGRFNFGHNNNDHEPLQHASSSGSSASSGDEVAVRTFLSDGGELIEDLGFRRARRKLAVPGWEYEEGAVVGDSNDHSGIAAIDRFGLLLVCCAWGAL